MKYRTLLVTLTTAAAITGVSAGSAGAATSTAEQVSSNWAGYVVGGSNSNTQFSNVSGSWVQPASKCTSGQDYAAFWVGIGGDDIYVNRDSRVETGRGPYDTVLGRSDASPYPPREEGP